MPNRIKRQILDLELPREERAYALQQQISLIFKEKVLPQFDEVFSTLVPEDVIIRIPTMEIDLGHLEETHWEREFITRCVNHVSEKIEALAIQETAVKGQAQWLALEENSIAIFVAFLRSGIHPWHAKHISNVELEQSIKKVIQDHPQKVKTQLSVSLWRESGVFQRLLWQFSPDFVKHIIETVRGLAPLSINQLEAVFEERYQLAITTQHREKLLQELLTIDISKETKGEISPQLWGSLLDQIFPKLIISTSKQKKQNTSIGQKEIAANINKNIAQLEDDHSSLKTKKKQWNKAKHKEQHNKHQDSNDYSKSLKIKNTSATEFIPSPNKTDEEEGFMIDFSGLVLFGAYLESFFKELDLVENGGFKTPDKQIKSVHLLHYLATGNEHPDEHTLLLPKVLCAMEITEAIPRDVSLLNREKEECNNLLKAVIRNWPALKNTSPNGLREGFIKRAGILYPPIKHSMWSLRVERMGQDLLLDRLPWGFATLKLPWIKKAIQTEW